MYAAGVLVLVLLGLEGLARMVPEAWLARETAGGQTTARSSPLVPSPTRIFRFQTGSILLAGATATIDADGLRVPLNAGAPGAPLVMTLGDSSIFGHGVQDGETLHDRLQVRLQAAGIATNVTTAAQPGYSTVQELAVMREAGWAREPSLLVIGTMWSDAHLDRYRDAEMVEQDHDQLLARSALYRLLEYGTATALGRPTARQVSWPTPSDAGIRRVPLGDYRDNLDELLSEAATRGVSAVLLGLPEIGWLASATTDEGTGAPYFKMLRDVAAARGVPFVDGVAAFKAYTGGEELFSDGLHPSATGQDLLAAAVSSAVVGAGWPAAKVVPRSGASNVEVPADPQDGNGALPRTSMLQPLGGNPAEETVRERPGLLPATPAAGSAPPEGSGGARPGMQSEVPPGMQPGMQPMMQPGMQPMMQPGMPPMMQPGIQSGMPPMMQPGMPPMMQPGMQQPPRP